MITNYFMEASKTQLLKTIKNYKSILNWLMIIEYIYVEYVK